MRVLKADADRRGLSGDMILNAGANHQTHIAEALAASTLPKGWPDWSYVRVQCPQLEACRDELAQGQPDGVPTGAGRKVPDAEWEDRV